MKICGHCGIPKILGAFYKDHHSRDGRRSSCKLCDKSSKEKRLNETPPEVLAAYNAKRRDSYREKHPRPEKPTTEERKQNKKLYNSQYYVSNTEKVKAKVREYYYLHQDTYQQYSRTYYGTHEESSKQYQTEYRKSNPEKCVQWTLNRHMRLHQALIIEDVDPLKIYERDGGLCHLCGRKVSKKDITMDHLICVSDKEYFPQAGHTYQNISLAHRSCNSRRNNGRLPAQLRLFG
jgi:5-methylcytosine-specific restriction endonuclease McrA